MVTRGGFVADHNTDVVIRPLEEVAAARRVPDGILHHTFFSGVLVVTAQRHGEVCQLRVVPRRVL